MRPGPSFGSLLVVLVSAVRLLAAEPAPVDYARDVEPLLRKSCYSCHGVDDQQGGLRLDLRSQAMAGGDRGKAIVVGKAAESLLVSLVSGDNKDIGIMPPEGEGTPLTTSQVALLRRWIDQGAKWPDALAEVGGQSSHWSFQPVAGVALPAVRDRAWLANPIDTFIRGRLEKEQVEPAPAADPTMRMRRLYLDLLGLPPSPPDVERFLADGRPDAYARVVDRVLSSPHYGERWGRHWLDLARYADSDGYEKDRPRPNAWRYREYVIDALNHDVAFDQFSIEQIAGDMLPEAGSEQRVASGFHRNTLHNTEGGTDKEEDRVKKTVDRTNTVGSIWLGLTVGCAQCHSHKYDPLSQREYYSFYGFFNSINETDVTAPLPHLVAAYERQKAEFDQAHAKYQAAISKWEQDELPQRQKLWETTARETVPAWQLFQGSASSRHGAEWIKQEDGSWLVAGVNKSSDVYEIQGPTPVKQVTALRLEVLPHKSLVKNGPGRAKNGNFVLTTLRLEVDGKPVEFVRARADFSQNEWDVKLAINANGDDGWAVSPQIGKRHVAVFETAEPVLVPEKASLRVTLDQKYQGDTHNLGHFRLSVTDATEGIDLDGLPPAVDAALRVAAEQRNEGQRKAIADYYRQLDPEWKKLQQAAAEHAKRAPQLPATKAQAVAENGSPRQTRVHIRGDFLNPGEPVAVGTPSVLPPVKKDSPPNRLDVAQWLFGAPHPLTSRVTANRVWQRFFGRGIVETIDDFGRQGARPSHPALLDWLARELQLGDWSLKRFHRLVVNSNTYAQSSAHRPELQDVDPENLLLARQVRRRVEAELIRDQALAASGLLDTRLGGPSVRPAQPAEYSRLTYANSAKWATSGGGDAYRRGLYTFFQRTSPYPMLMTFDAPDSNACAVQRSTSNTPLQALTLWNDGVFFECSQHLARRVSAHTGDAEARIEYAYLLCLARHPNEHERSTVLEYWERTRKFCGEHADAAKAICGDEPLAEGVDAADLAAWVMVARTLLNLDEFVTKE